MQLLKASNLDQKMSNFTTPTMLIVDYYDSLINEIDVYTEKLLKRTSPESVLSDIHGKQDTALHEASGRNKSEDYGVTAYTNPYSMIYKFEAPDYEKILPVSKNFHEYVNMSRERMIVELRQAQQANLDYYRSNKDKFEYDPDQMSQEEEIEKLREQIFENKFCFVFKNENDESNETKQATDSLDLFTLILDFYVNSDELTLLK